MPKSKELKRKEAEQMKEKRAERTIDQQLSELSKRPGDSRIERARLIQQKKTLKNQANA